MEGTALRCLDIPALSRALLLVLPPVSASLLRRPVIRQGPAFPLFSLFSSIYHYHLFPMLHHLCTFVKSLDFRMFAQYTR